MPECVPVLGIARARVKTAGARAGAKAIVSLGVARGCGLRSCPSRSVATCGGTLAGTGSRVNAARRTPARRTLAVFSNNSSRAVNAYLDLVSKHSFLEAVASSLTELFSRDLIALRIDRLRQYYPWLSGGLAYFDARLTQAPEDAQFALAWVIEHARTPKEHELALGALRAKCDILWAQLDALYFAYVAPGWPPPGTFQPAVEAAPK